MVLCAYCRALDFSALPAPRGWNPFRLVFSDSQMNVFNASRKDNEILRFNDSGLYWQDNLDTLAKSAALNCPLCTIIQHAVKNWNDRRQAGRNSSTFYQELGDIYDCTLPNKRLYLAQRLGRGPGFVVFIPCGDHALLLASVAFTAGEASPLARKLHLRPFCEDSGSSGALRVVSSWLKNCQDSHEKCCYVQTTLPSRVLAVGCIGDSSIRLIEPDAGTVGKYASLSHCWGLVTMLKTTRTSLHAHMSGILVADLPKTFRDAVAVSRYLDIPYLWIDSLCIIQGDTEDWVRESSRMTNVYSNAYLVIAANQASDSAGGCFHIRPPRVSANLALPGIGLVHAQLGVNSDELLFLSAKFSDEPLTKRAWALQERLLAARTIHYNTGQMYFECRDGIVGEDGCKSDTPYCDLSPIMNHTCSTREALQTWSSILWAYGDRNLTEPTDKFPAISGIANLLGGMLKDEYVAGLWSRKMVQGLAWQGLGRQLQPINQYIGPSWSWASLQGIAALNTEPNWRSIAIVEDWQVELTNPDNRYGQVNSASVRVRGPIIQLMESTIPGGDYDNSLKRAGLRPKPRLRTKYSGEGGDMTLYLDNEGQNASIQWEEMDMKVLLLGGYEATPPASECEAEEEALKKDKGNRDFEIGEGFGLVLTSKNENGAIYMTRVGWMALVCSEVKRLRESKEDWDTVTII